MLKKCNAISQIIAALLVTFFSISTQAASYELNSTITECSEICSIFTSTGQIVSINFDTQYGATNISTDNISDIGIAVSQSPDVTLELVDAIALSSVLIIDASNNLISGAARFQGLFAPHGIFVQADIDISAGTTTFLARNFHGDLIKIGEADITSSIASGVPVPAAAWFFSSSLIGLVSIKRKK